jgi:lipase ATG15
MRAILSVQLAVVYLVFIVSCAPGSDASGLSSWDLRLPELPFLSTVQTILSSMKPTSRYSSPKKMRLRSVYHQGTHSYRGLSARYDVSASDSSIKGVPIGDNAIYLTSLKTTTVKTWRPKDASAFLLAHRLGDDMGVKQSSQQMEWDEVEVDAPDVSDRETLLALSKMASKAYDAPVDSSDGGWVTGGGKWNLSESFGWVEDGIRGHIFATEDNATIVVALKGTSAALLDNGSTSKRDKENVSSPSSVCYVLRILAEASFLTFPLF